MFLLDCISDPQFLALFLIALPLCCIPGVLFARSLGLWGPKARQSFGAMEPADRRRTAVGWLITMGPAVMLAASIAIAMVLFLSPRGGG